MKSVAIVFMVACVLSVPVQAALVYVDASPTNTANVAGGNWYASPASVTDSLWGLRTPFGNNDAFVVGPDNEIFEAYSGENAPVSVTTASGLTPGLKYEVSVIYWSNNTSSNNWCIRAGLSQGGMTLFDRTGLLTGATAGTLTGKTGTNLVELSGFLGQIAADVNGQIKVYIDDLPAAGNTNRAWYDGVLLTRYLPKAYGPDPASGATGVGIPNSNSLLDVTLRWKAGVDPNGVYPVNPLIKKHYLYLSSNKTVYPADPNLYYKDEIAVTSWTDPNAVYTFIGTNGLQFDGLYQWRVDEGLDNGKGGVYPPGDPNNSKGTVWSFNTTSSTPTFTLQPKYTKVDRYATATLRAEYTAARTVTGVKWYRDSVEVTTGVFFDQTYSTLTITNADFANEGQYYCVVTAGGSAQSAAAGLAIKELLAWYQFENNATDSAGSNGGPQNGTAMGTVTYPSTSFITGQSYAVGVDGSGYIELSRDAFPKAGFGNGMDEFTIFAWIKKDAVPAADMCLLGTLNTNGTSIQILLRTSGNIYCDVRSTNQTTQVNAAAASLYNNQWHLIAVTYNGFEYNPGEAGNRLRAYLDGVEIGTSGSLTVAGDQMAAWQYPVELLARQLRGTVDAKFVGQADDLKIYNYAKSADDIAQVYFGVTGQRPCTQGSPDYDFTGPAGVPDCIVNIYDFAEFAGSWLEDGYWYLP